MARTVNPEARAVRREAFVDTALRLIQAKGYEQMSVQDVLDDLEASRGAFYHYFDGKIALLEAAVDRIVDAAMEAVMPVVADPELPALRKLERLFSGIAGWKSERMELMLALLRVWYSDDNAIVRDKVRRSMVARLVPPLTEIIRQGVADGEFTASCPEDAARAVVSLLDGAQDLACELFFARRAGEATFEFVQARFAGHAEAMERILGVLPGALSLIDDRTLRLWFG
ncbi:MAG: TetR/AcrR family transcriptional regulator [Candidatus Dormibacteria bacterium]